MSVLSRWARDELAPWRGRRLTRATSGALIDAAAERHGGLFRYDISKTTVTCSSKQGEFLGPGVPEAYLTGVLWRAECYRALLEQCLPLLRINDAFAIAIDVSDIAPVIADLPLFCFQKPSGSPLILLPDIDLIRLDYLEGDDWIDVIPFEQKIDKAVFVGSTTGGTITEEVVRELGLPRLRAAVAHKHSPNVDFYLPNILQCDSTVTENLVRQLDVGGRIMDWEAQLNYRHLLSMDGNGAACSRMAIALNSNSVLVKYVSPHELFYFKGLKPGLHYVSIASDEEVEAIFAASPDQFAKQRQIAHAGQDFAHLYLRRKPCVNYVAELLKQYLKMMNAAEGQTGANVRADLHYAIRAVRRSLGRLYRRLRPG